MSGRLPALLALAILAAASAAGRADEGQTFSSGSEQVALVELYTSEGCSSCPPADRWLSRLDGDADLWARFVPVAFHVDYWDYIGWQDRFAERAHSDRQRRYIDEGAARVVYTPGMFVAGQEWLDWRRGDDPPHGRAKPGELTVRVDDGSIAVQFAPSMRKDAALRVHVAILGMGLESDVTRGENRGRRLQHDFVVLDHKELRMTRSSAGYKAIAALDDAGSDGSRALAVWVSAADSLTPIQATGGLLN